MDNYFNNSALLLGTGIYLNNLNIIELIIDSIFNLNSCGISNDEAQGDGGALALYNNNTILKILNVSILNNKVF